MNEHIRGATRVPQGVCSLDERQSARAKNRAMVEAKAAGARAPSCSRRPTAVPATEAGRRNSAKSGGRPALQRGRPALAGLCVRTSGGRTRRRGGDGALVAARAAAPSENLGSSEKIGVIFVCLGNICRSPTAEGERARERERESSHSVARPIFFLRLRADALPLLLPRCSRLQNLREKRGGRGPLRHRQLRHRRR